MSVMLHLSEKIMLDKVQDNYIFHPNNRINLEDEARLSFTPDVVKSINAEVGKFYSNFITSIFVLLFTTFISLF